MTPRTSNLSFHADRYAACELVVSAPRRLIDVSTNLVKTIIVICFCIIIHPNISLASSFSTPKDTMETMLDAARRADAHLWSACASDIDKNIYSLSVGKKKEQELLSEKSRVEMMPRMFSPGSMWRSDETGSLSS